MMLKLGVFYDYLLTDKKVYDGDWLLTINFTDGEVYDLRQLLNSLCHKNPGLYKLFGDNKEKWLLSRKSEFEDLNDDDSNDDEDNYEYKESDYDRINQIQVKINNY